MHYTVLLSSSILGFLVVFVHTVYGLIGRIILFVFRMKAMLNGRPNWNFFSPVRIYKVR